MTRPILALTLLACVGFLVWMLCVDFGQDVEEASQPMRAERPSAEPEPASELVREVDRGAEHDHASAGRPTAIPGHVQAPVAADAKDGVEVRVVLQSSGKPVVGARVRGLGLLERTPDTEGPELVPIGLVDPEAELGDAPLYVTDAEGRTRVPRSTLPADYAASAGELWGTSYFSDSAEPPYVIELAPDATFRVQVVDAGGRTAAGLPVALGCAGAPRDDLWSALTDPLGFVEVRHWAAARQKCLDPEEACMRAVLLARDEDLPVLFYDVARATQEPLKLVLPPLGRVEVRATTADGLVLCAPDLLLSRAADAGRDGQPRRDAEVFEPEGWNAKGAVFERVGLGLELRASSRAIGFNGAFVVGPGPKGADETALLQLVVGEPVPALTGRLIGPDGERLRSRAARLLSPGRGHDGVGSAPDFETDAEGRFRVLLHQRPGPIAHLRFRVGIAYTDEQAIVHRCDLPLPDMLVAPETELGDLYFAPMALIANGQVVDELGFPVQAAHVRAKALGPDGTDITPAAHLHGPTQIGGAFEIFGEVSGQRWLLTASAMGCEIPAPLEIAPGSRGVRFVLGAGGSARGSVVLGLPDVGSLVAIFESRRASAEIQAARFTRCAIDEQGRFRFAAAHGGRYDLVVKPAGDGSILARIEGVELVPGVECSDPRLSSIELRPSHVQEPSGRPR